MAGERNIRMNLFTFLVQRSLLAVANFYLDEKTAYAITASTSCTKLT
jgi:hypothetical protein